MSCANSSASARQKCKKTVCLLAGNCGCKQKSSFFSGPRTLLQDINCGSNCDAPITVEAWSGGFPGTPGATGTTVGLELCDKLIFWSESLDLQVAEGSALVNLEIPGATGGLGPDFWRDDVGGLPNGVGDTGKTLVHNNDINIGVNGNMTVGNRSDETDTVVGNGAMASGVAGGRVAVGYLAGNTQGINSVAVGNQAGFSQGESAVAIGVYAGSNSQKSNAIAVGAGAGNVSQGSSAISVGSSAGFSNQGQDALAVGTKSGEINQGQDAIAIGRNAGATEQTIYSIAIGTQAGESNQGTLISSGSTGSSIAIGYQAGQNTQANESVAIGYQAGQNTQANESVAIGYQAGQNTQANESVAIGYQAGYFEQDYYSVAIGYQAGYTGQKARSIAIGAEAGKETQGKDSVAIGRLAGGTTQGINAVAIGNEAGYYNQGDYAIAIGDKAGGFGSSYTFPQGQNTICIGRDTRATGVTGSIALGLNAGADKSNELVISLGYSVPQTFKTFFEVKDTMAAPVTSLVYIKIGNDVYALHATKAPVAPNDETIPF